MKHGHSALRFDAVSNGFRVNGEPMTVRQVNQRAGKLIGTGEHSAANSALVGRKRRE